MEVLWSESKQCLGPCSGSGEWGLEQLRQSCTQLQWLSRFTRGFKVTQTVGTREIFQTTLHPTFQSFPTNFVYSTEGWQRSWHHLYSWSNCSSFIQKPLQDQIQISCVAWVFFYFISFVSQLFWDFYNYFQSWFPSTNSVFQVSGKKLYVLF